MRTASHHPTLALVLACTISLLFFLLGITFPQANFWGRYLLPIVIVFLWSRRRDIYVVAILAGVLLTIEYLAEAAPLNRFLTTYLLPLAVMWGVAWLLAQRRQMQEDLERHGQELDEQVKVRTAALAAREEQLAKIFRANPGGIAIIRQSDSCYLEANDAYLAMVGYTRDQLIGHTSVELGIVPVERRAKMRAAFETQGYLYGQNVQLINARGEPIDTYYSSEAIEYAGAPCYLALMVDITENRQLEETNYRLAAFVESSTDAIVSTDMQGRVVGWNRSAEQMYGCSASQAIGRPINEVLPTRPDADEAAMVARVSTGDTISFSDLNWTKADGTKVDLSISLLPVKDKHGAVIGMATVAHDVTERKRLENALAANEARLREAYQRLQLVIDAADIGVWNWDFADGSLEWDERMCELYEVPPEQRRGKLHYELWRERVHPDDRDQAEPSHGDPVHSRTPWSTTFRIVLPGGGIRYLQVNAIKQFDKDGQPLRMIGVNRDVTDQKQYELLLRDTNAALEERVAERTADLQAALVEVQAANRLKDEFMAMISHELRTPLTGVLTLTELLGEQVGGTLTDRQAAYVQGIARSGARLLYVVNGILGYVHLLSGNVQFNAIPCEIRQLLAICATAEQHKAAAKDQEIAVTVEPPDLAVTADATALAEVIKHLLDNAIKFTPAGGRIGLEAHPTAAQGQAPGTVDLLVWDTGVGIPVERIAHILKPFVQADGSLARSQDGMGLGLAYADQMVRLMGGTLRLESTPGEGSRFTVTLPA